MQPLKRAVTSHQAYQVVSPILMTITCRNQTKVITNDMIVAMLNRLMKVC